MKRSVLAVSATAIAVLFLQALSIQAQEIYHGGAPDARQHGYEHGYREGFAFGQNSQVSNRDQDMVNQKLRAADRDYQPGFGSRELYRQGYADGFRAGIEDARTGNRSRLEDLFRARDPNYDPDRNRDDRIDGIYSQNRWPPAHVGRDIGYRDGFDAAMRDRQEGRGYVPRQHSAWETAMHGYDGQSSRRQYQRAYRESYELGYNEAFQRRPGQ